MNQMITEARTMSTQSAIKALRSEGKIPAVVYGENIESATISVDQKQVTQILRTNPNAVLQMEVPEQGKHPVMIIDIQREPVTRNIIHLDFQQINVKNAISVQVRIDQIGQAKGVSDGGIVQTVLNELTVSCLPHLIPTSITVDVSELNIGDSLTVADLELPADVEAMTAPEEVVVSVLAPQVTDETEEEEAEDGETAEQEQSEEAPSEE